MCVGKSLCATAMKCLERDLHPTNRGFCPLHAALRDRSCGARPRRVRHNTDIDCDLSRATDGDGVRPVHRAARLARIASAVSSPMAGLPAT